MIITRREALKNLYSCSTLILPLQAVSSLARASSSPGEIDYIVPHGAPYIDDCNQIVRKLWRLNEPARLIRSICFSRDASLLAADCRDHRFKASIDIAQVFEGGPPHISTFGQSPTLTIWDAATGGVVKTIGACPMPTDAISFSPDGKKIAFGGPEAYRPREAEVQKIVERMQRDLQSSLRISGEALIEQAGALLRVQDLKSGANRLSLVGHEFPIIGIGFGKHITSIDSNNNLRVWDPSVGRCLLAVDKNEEKGDMGILWRRNSPLISFDEEAKSAVSVVMPKESQHGGQSGCVLKLWDVSRTLYRFYETRSKMVASVVLSPDGSRLAIAFGDLSVVILDIMNLTRLLELKMPEGPTPCLSFSPDGSRLISAARFLRVWDSSSGRLLDTLPAMEQIPRRLGFSNGSLRVACCNETIFAKDSPLSGVEPYAGTLTVFQARLSPGQATK